MWMKGAECLTIVPLLVIYPKPRLGRAVTSEFQLGDLHSGATSILCQHTGMSHIKPISQVAR
jgi:hypothetical protein